MSRYTTRAYASSTLLLILLLGPRPDAALGFSSGPPDGFCGDPPAFSNCTACHTSFPVNSGIGTLELLALPSSYSPGTTYPLTISLQDAEAGRERWGFEMTAIQEDNGLRGGNLTAVNPSLVQISNGSGDNRDYLKHTSTGTFAGQTAGATWEIEWTAPEAGTGDVHFYLAGNAASNSAGNQLDYIYTIDLPISEQTTDVGLPPLAVDYLDLRVFPNPSPGERIVRFSLPAAAGVDLRIVDARGRSIRSLASGRMAAGDYRVEWDGTDAGGHPSPTGVYFTILVADQIRSFERILIVR